MCELVLCDGEDPKMYAIKAILITFLCSNGKGQMEYIFVFSTQPPTHYSKSVYQTQPIPDSTPVHIQLATQVQLCINFRRHKDGQLIDNCIGIIMIIRRRKSLIVKNFPSAQWWYKESTTQNSSRTIFVSWEHIHGCICMLVVENGVPVNSVKPCLPLLGTTIRLERSSIGLIGDIKLL